MKGGIWPHILNMLKGTLSTATALGVVAEWSKVLIAVH